MQTTLERPDPALHQFDVGDHYRMAEVGILSPDDRVELIEGGSAGMAPIGGVHGGAAVDPTALSGG